MDRVDGIMQYEFGQLIVSSTCPCHTKPGTHASLYPQTQHQILIPIALGHDTGACEQP